MKKNFLYCILFSILSISVLTAQVEIPQGYVPGNRTLSASLEKNILFNATSRFTVTQTGNQGFDSNQLSKLFDGSMEINYTWGIPITSNNPMIIEIDNLPNVHVQVGAWVGFSTRYWTPKKFKIEGWDSWGTNNWVLISNIDNNILEQYIVQVNNGSFTKLKITFYEGCATSSSPTGQMGLSEIFFIHPEAAQAYDGLLLKSNANGSVGIGTTIPTGNLEVASSTGGVLSISTNKINGSPTSPLFPRIDFLGYDNGNKARISATEQTSETYGSKLSIFVNDGDSATSLKERLTINADGYVGIGTTIPDQMLTVNGTIHAKEVIVTVDIPADYVFHPSYNLMPLHDVEQYVKINSHLPEIPSAAEIIKKGMSIGEMQNKLLQKIEELTLYMIKQQKEIDFLKQVRNK
jgi:hypothetical protein